MSTTLADRQTEREQLKAERAREQYEQALAETCVADDVHGGARLLRDVVARAVADLPERLAAAIEGQTEEAAIHYHLSDCVHDVLREVGEQVAAGTRETMPELGEAVRRGVQPRDLLTVSQWADRYRWLDSGTNIPGQWRTDRVPYLREPMDSLSEHSSVREVSFMKAAGVGGPLALDTAIPTPDGWTTMGAIGVGDRVFDERGRPCEVTYTSPVFTDRTCYRIRFGDGSEIVADDEHRWTVEDAFPGHAGKRRGEEGPRSRTVTTRELRRTYRHRGRNRYAIPVAEPLALPERELPLPPYVLGAWLANGQWGANQLTTHEDDAEAVAALIRSAGTSARARKMEWNKGRSANVLLDTKGRTEGLCLRGHVLDYVGWYRNRSGIVVCRECQRQHAMHGQYGRERDPVVTGPGFLSSLRELGITDYKKIPQCYLRASSRQRWELLRGLMDADGSITRGRCEYSTVSDALARGMLELLRSLGFKPVCYAGRRKGFGSEGGEREGVQYRISFLAYEDTPVFHLERKRARQPERASGRPMMSTRRRVVSIERVATRPVRCIGVDASNHLYLAGEAMVATHNTEVLWNWVGYIMHHLENKDTMLVVPSLELRNRSFNPRLRKVIDETPVLKDRVSSASRNRTNRDDLLEFGARARLIKAGANSADSLRSDHLPYVITDEVDGFPWEVGDEGDPLTLIENRQRTFSRAKTYRVSTPTVEQASRIDQAYKRSDRRLYHVPCPHCGHEHPLEWKHFQFRTATGDEPEPGGVPQVTQAWMFCPGCGGTIEEGHKPAMLAGGRWIAQRPRVRRHRGYHLNALYAPVGLGLTWRDVAQKWVACQDDASELKGFVNTYLGEVWREEGDSIDDLSLITRLEPYGPDDVPIVLITAGVDVQADRLELSVYGWGAGEESWALDHIILPGQTAVKGEGAWMDLEPALLDAGVQYACIDSGYHADAAKGFVEERRWCFATNGMPGMQRPVVEDERRRRQRLRYRRKKGAPVEPIGVDNAKSILYARLKMPEAGPGYIHFRQAPAFDDEFFAQLGAEKLVKRVKRGRSTVEWVQDRARNEALDCAVLALAAVRLAGQDLDALARAGRYIRAGRRQSAGAGSGEKQPPASTPGGNTGFGSEDWTL